MELVKRIWHDPVWSKVIAAAILFGASRLVRYWPPNLLASVNHWFDTPITFTLTRGDLVNWPLLVASMGLSLYTIVVGIRRIVLDAQNANRDTTKEQTRSVSASTAAPTLAPAAAPTPLELTDTEAAVLSWCGHQWQPGIPVGIGRGALELSMSSLQVAKAVDGLYSKGFVSKVGPNGVSLTPSGRDLCVERGWHGGLEAARRRDPRSPV